MAKKTAGVCHIIASSALLSSQHCSYCLRYTSRECRVVLSEPYLKEKAREKKSRHHPRLDHVIVDIASALKPLFGSGVRNQIILLARILTQQAGVDEAPLCASIY